MLLFRQRQWCWNRQANGTNVFHSGLSLDDRLHYTSLPQRHSHLFGVTFWTSTKDRQLAGNLKGAYPWMSMKLQTIKGSAFFRRTYSHERPATRFIRIQWQNFNHQAFPYSPIKRWILFPHEFPRSRLVCLWRWNRKNRTTSTDHSKNTQPSFLLKWKEGPGPGEVFWRTNGLLFFRSDSLQKMTEHSCIDSRLFSHQNLMILSFFGFLRTANSDWISGESQVYWNKGIGCAEKSASARDCPEQNGRLFLKNTRTRFRVFFYWKNRILPKCLFDGILSLFKDRLFLIRRPFPNCTLFSVLIENYF